MAYSTKTAQANKDTAQWLAQLQARVANDKMRAANRRLAFKVALAALTKRAA